MEQKLKNDISMQELSKQGRVRLHDGCRRSLDVKLGSLKKAHAHQLVKASGRNPKRAWARRVL